MFDMPQSAFMMMLCACDYAARRRDERAQLRDTLRAMLSARLRAACSKRYDHDARWHAYVARFALPRSPDAADALRAKRRCCAECRGVATLDAARAAVIIDARYYARC